MNPWILRCLSLAVVCLFHVALCAAPPPQDAGSTVKLPLLQTPSGSYTNVTVVLVTPPDIHIRHDGGVKNIPLAELNSTVLRQLGLAPEAEAAEQLEAEAAGDAAGDGSFFGLDGPEGFQNLDVSRFLGGAALSGGLVFAFLGVSLIGYLFTCYCYMRICRNAGHEAGFLIWLPIVQMIPLFRAAGMSPWWLLALFVPLLNLVAIILWCFKIVSACGKSAVWAVLFLLPLLNLIAFLYLAFSTPGGRTPSQPTAVGEPVS